MAYYVYILHCADGSYYTGHTEDLETRVYEHQEGTFPGYTKTRLPVELVFFDELPSRFDALDREKQIKGWSRAKKKALVDGDWEMLRKLSGGKVKPKEQQSRRPKPLVLSLSKDGWTESVDGSTSSPPTDSHQAK